MNEPRIGDLRERLVVFDWRDEPDANGRLKKVLVPAFRCWTKPEVVGSAAYWGSAQIEETVTHRFWVRTVPNLTDSISMGRRSKLSFRGAEFRIKRVSDYQERHRWTIVEAEQLGASNGC